MDKLITTNNGGMPFDLDDIRWIEKGINDNFQAIGRAMANDNTDVFVLWGCALSDGGTTWSLASGAIWARDEIWLVDAHTINKLAASGSYYMKQVITNDATGSETFESGATVDTYQKRRLELTNTDIDGASTGDDVTNVNVLSLPTFADKFATWASVNTLDGTVVNINDNRLRATTIYQQVNFGASYGSWADLSNSFSSRIGDSSMHPLSNSLGVQVDPFSIYRFTINSITYASDVIRIKNVPSGAVLSSPMTRDGSGNVDFNPTADPTSFIMINNQNVSAALGFAVKFDGDLTIVVEKIG